MAPPHPTDSPQAIALTAVDAHDLAEAHYNLALIYSRISGVRLYKKQSVDQRPKVTAEFPGLRSQDVASKIGEAWRGLDSEAREEYADIAAGLREKYFSDIGDYKRRMFRKGQHPLENDEGEDDAGADDDAIDVPASQDPDLAAANGHGHGHGKKKKRRSGEPGSEKPRKSKSKSSAGDAGTPKKKKKRSRDAAE